MLDGRARCRAGEKEKGRKKKKVARPGIEQLFLASITTEPKRIQRKEPQKKQKRSRRPHLIYLTQAPNDRNPVRHATVKMPLQSEASLKRHHHCLGPRAAIAGFPGEWVATAAFELGVIRGF